MLGVFTGTFESKGCLVFLSAKDREPLKNALSKHLPAASPACLNGQRLIVRRPLSEVKGQTSGAQRHYTGLICQHGHSYTHTHPHIHPHTHADTHKHGQRNTRIHPHTHADKHIHTYTHTPTLTHTYTQTSTRLQSCSHSAFSDPSKCRGMSVCVCVHTSVFVSHAEGQMVQALPLGWCGALWASQTWD